MHKEKTKINNTVLPLESFGDIKTEENNLIMAVAEYDVLKSALKNLTDKERDILLEMKESIIKGVFDEDLYQELCIILIRCIQGFKL